MTYYFFDRCSRTCLPQIEQLARELNLREYRSAVRSGRGWEGEPFKRRAKFDRSLLVTYSSRDKYPLKLQTSEKTTHQQGDVKRVIQRFIAICNPRQIYNMLGILHNMKEFA